MFIVHGTSISRESIYIGPYTEKGVAFDVIQAIHNHYNNKHPHHFLMVKMYTWHVVELRDLETLIGNSIQHQQVFSR